MVQIIELDDDSNDSGMPASSVPPLPSKQHSQQLILYSRGYFRQMDGPHLPSSATIGAHLHKEDAKTKIEEANSSAPPKELLIIDAKPLTMVPPLNQKARRGKRARGPLLDGREIGLPEGWLYEKRQRTNANYVGKIDQFFYEPGTNKQFRSTKEVEKHLQSKGQQINRITPQRLQQNDPHKPEAAETIDLDTNDNAGSSNPETHLKKRKRRMKFDFKNPPEEVTWVLADAKADNWTAFMGHDEKVPDDTQRHWAKTFLRLNKPKNHEHHNK